MMPPRDSQFCPIEIGMSSSSRHFSTRRSIQTYAPDVKLGRRPDFPSSITMSRHTHPSSKLKHSARVKPRIFPADIYEQLLRGANQASLTISKGSMCSCAVHDMSTKGRNNCGLIFSVPRRSTPWVRWPSMAVENGFLLSHSPREVVSHSGRMSRSRRYINSYPIDGWRSPFRTLSTAGVTMMLSGIQITPI